MPKKFQGAPGFSSGAPCVYLIFRCGSFLDGLPALPGRCLFQVPGADGTNCEACDRGAVCGGPGQAGAAVGAAAGRHFTQRVGGAPC